MLCPNCNAEVTEAKFCENCGAALPVETPEQPTAQVEQPAVQVEQPAAQAEQPAAQAAQPTAQFQQPMGQAPQPGAYAPMPTTAPAGPEPSSAPFVLAIIALVTAILGMFPVSIILAIIALVMNSGQKKRGEFSTKQTPTFVMGLISIILSAIVALVVALVVGIVGVAAVNGEFDDIKTSSASTLSASSSTSASTSNSTSASSSAKPGAKIAATDDLVGSWKLSGLVEDGEETAAEEIAMMQKMGLEVSLNLDKDGTATLVLFGVEMKGTWEAPSPYFVHLSLEGETIVCDIDTDTAELSMTEGDDELTFTKA